MSSRPALYEFGDYVLDVARCRLRKAGRDVELRPKSYEVLLHLVENCGRLVSKEELLRKVWPNVIVTDESLTQCVSEVRHAIQDRGQLVIKTTPKRGYTFEIAKVRREDVTQDAEVRLTPPAHAPSGGGPGFRLKGIAVLPFVNLSDDPAQEHLSDGITEDIITELSRFSEFQIVARHSTLQYKRQSVDVRQIGAELGVRYLVEGSVRRAANRVRATAQLIDAKSGTQIWGDRYDHELSDEIAAQERLARRIVTVVASNITQAEAAQTLLKPVAQWDAYDFLLRGAEAFRNALTGGPRSALRSARELLFEALRIDPNCARAYALLARTQLYGYIEPFDKDYLDTAALDLAQNHAKQALRLDSNLPESHSQFAWVLMFLRQHGASLSEFERSIDLNRNFSDHGYGLALVFDGQAARAVDIVRASLQIDPTQYRRLGVLGHAYYMAGKSEEAARLLREAAACNPTMRIMHLWLAAAYAGSKLAAQAASAARDLLRIEPDFTIRRWRPTAVYKNDDDIERLCDSLRRAGLPP